MASAVSIVDTGPLVAALDKSEPHHDWAVAQLALLTPPLLTCEAVLSEAAFVMRRSSLDESLPLGFAERGMVRAMAIADSEQNCRLVRRLMERYSDVPMSFADACLVRLAERHPGAQILTFDSDFRIYRTTDRRAIPVITPSP